MSTNSFQERTEADFSSKTKDPESPVVYKAEFEIFDHDSEGDENQDNNYQVSVENDNFTMSTAFEGTGMNGFLNVDDDVYGLIESDNPYMKWVGTQVLGQVADARSFNLLKGALDSELFDVRWGAAMAISEIAKKWIMWHLVRAINNDDNRNLNRIVSSLQDLWTK